MSYFYMKKSELFHCESRLTSPLPLPSNIASCDNRAQTNISFFLKKFNLLSRLVVKNFIEKSNNFNKHATHSETFAC